MKKSVLIVLLLTVLVSVTAFAMGGQDENTETEQVVNVYSHRHYDVDQELYDRFTELTGIKVNVVKANADELIERLRSEGPNSPADVLITVDAGRLYKAKEMGLLQSVNSSLLEGAVPAYLRDSEGFWFGLTKRARVIAYHKTRVNPSELSTYEDLADEKWKGRLVVRSSSNIYNQSLLASLIEHNGRADALEWAKLVIANMAREPKGNDRDQVKAIASGQADIAVINTYYLGKLVTSSDEAEVAAGNEVGLFFPNQNGRGTHINVSGAGIIKTSKNYENAVKFIEFLVSVEAQEKYAQANYEYPVRTDVKPSDLVASWGAFKDDQVSLSVLGANNSEAVIVFDEANWK